ncbi:MAG: quinone-dependent dihydroorotate dehydrogenase [Deltaproteobacteria bacterium]|nr:quinone-dependent dihydroorotate dehydrogenase [Deltaproteobacteria bacterium]
MLYSYLRPLLFSLDPERAHHSALKAISLLQKAGAAAIAPLSDPYLSQELWGLRFPNPVGLAAGYDKNAVAPLAWSALGFGFAELGTITARPQPGNPRPRIFRLEHDQALINRLGFNNDGAHAVAARLIRTLPPGRHHPIPLGFNIGKSKSTPLEQAAEDYVESTEQLFPFADYLVVNVSSPNTPELRKLQESERLQKLLETLIAANRRLALQRHTQPKPVLVKIAPDLSDEELVEIAGIALATGVAGLIATNTTIARPPTLRTAIQEDGGLSGRPLTSRALTVMRLLFRTVNGKLPLIGVGGIFSVEDAYARLRAGASLIQLYTGLIYEGPLLPRRIVRGLRIRLLTEGVSHLREVVGRDA